MIIELIIIIIIGCVVYYLLPKHIMGICLPLKSDKNTEFGEKCDYDCDCKSGACGRATAADNAGKICTTSVIRYAGFDYSNTMKKGDVCWSDAMCGGVGGSKYCRGNAGGTKKGKCGKLELGEKCDISDNCKSGKCSRATADDNAPKICATSTTEYSGFDYSKQMKKGDTCWSDAMCGGVGGDKYCRGNVGGFKKGKCGKLEIGELSDKDANCKSGSAGRMDNNNKSKTVCCPSGKLTMNSRDFCKKVIPSGQKCTRATQCISNNCKGNASGTKQGKCK